MNVWITTSVLHSSQMILFPIASFAKFSCLHHRRSSQFFRAMTDHRVSHFMAKNNLKDFYHKKTFYSHRQLIVIFAEVKHSLVDKDVSAWKYKCVPDRLWEYDNFEDNLISFFSYFIKKGLSTWSTTVTVHCWSQICRISLFAINNLLDTEATLKRELLNSYFELLNGHNS